MAECRIMVKFFELKKRMPELKCSNFYGAIRKYFFTGTYNECNFSTEKPDEKYMTGLVYDSNQRKENEQRDK